MKINLCDGQPSRPRLQWTLTQKTATVQWKDSFQFNDGDYLCNLELKK